MSEEKKEDGIFYERDRQTAKAHATHPLTFAYIETLECIAKTSYALWCASNRSVEERNNELYDALSLVNFFDESQ